MIQENTYQAKFNALSDWMPYIMKAVKKDLKNEHLKRDALFARHYLAGRDPNKLTDEEFATIYTDAIANSEKGEALGDFIANRWIMKNGDIYHYFAAELSKITADFNELKELDKPTSLAIIEGAVEQFGAPDAYLFSMLNSVVFPSQVFTDLEKRAKVDLTHKKTAEEKQKKLDDLESMQRQHEQQIARLTDKYEKKLQGLQAKYQTDTSQLKNKVADLQRKMSAKA